MTIDGKRHLGYELHITKLADDATHARGDSTNIANWRGYGAEVLAVADGVIFDVADDMPEGATLSAATGVPFVFRNFEELGAYPDIDAFASGERWQPFPAATGRRGLELPAANTVIMFSDARE